MKTLKTPPRTRASSKLEEEKVVPPPLPLKILDRIEKEQMMKREGRRGAKKIVTLKTQFEVPKELATKIGMPRAFLTKLKNLPGNDRCCDCGEAQPQFASIALSSLVCINCAGAHRSLGDLKSRIKSLRLDSWSTPEIARMLAGGNARLKNALQSDSARWSVTGEPFSMYTAYARYDSEDADEYADALDYECGQSCEDLFDDDEAPGFGEFLVEQAWQLRAKKAQVFSPCADLNRATENGTGVFGCITRSFSCLFESLTRRSGE